MVSNDKLGTAIEDSEPVPEDERWGRRPGCDEHKVKVHLNPPVKEPTAVETTEAICRCMAINLDNIVKLLADIRQELRENPPGSAGWIRRLYHRLRYGPACSPAAEKVYDKIIYRLLQEKEEAKLRVIALKNDNDALHRFAGRMAEGKTTAENDLTNIKEGMEVFVVRPRVDQWEYGKYLYLDEVLRWAESKAEVARIK